MNKWTNFLKYYVSNKEYKLWDMDTKFDGILKLFKRNLERNNINEESFKTLEVVPTSRSPKDPLSYRYILVINGMNITPISRGIDGSSGAIRQYLQVLDMAGIISFTNQTLKDKKLSYDAIDTSFISMNIDEIIFEVGKRILEIGFGNPKRYVRNAWLSLILSMIYSLDKQLFDDIEMNTLFQKAKKRDEDTLHGIVKDIQYTYETFYNGSILDYFKKYKDSIIINDFIFKATGERAANVDRDELAIYILDQVDKRRWDISNLIRIIRNYSFNSDLESINVPLNSLDCAHIKSVSKIKQSALIESSRRVPNKEKINELLSQINDKNNVILIPHNYHYLLDKGYLFINHEGFFVKTDPGNLIYKEFGIKDNATIKKELISSEMKRYINEQ